MAKPWAASFSYRDAVNELERRFEVMSTSDSAIHSDLCANIHTLNGYLLAINSAPATVSATEWLADLLPLVQVDDEKPADSVNLLISYAIHLKNRAQQQKYAIAQEADALAAFVPSSPMNSFSLGFARGYERIQSIWSAKIAKALEAELSSQVFALSFFASTEHANRFIKEKGLKLRPEQLADQVLASFEKAVDLHVRLGMATEADGETFH